MSVISKYTTFDEFLNKTYNEFLNKTYDVNKIYMDTELNTCIIFEHVPNYCKAPCKHIVNGIQCNGTPIRVKSISNPNGEGHIICSLPSEYEYKNRFIPIKSSNNRW